ncbi:MAG: methyl-accepting chemotaxis protein [Nitrospiraceae bacterium]|nr:methyl-accepting chemotaxis protein [Nitrospiraceae bacterium]
MKGLFKKFLSMRLKSKVLAGYVFISFLIVGILAIISVNFFKIKGRYDSIIAMSGDIQLTADIKTNINAVRAAFLRMALSRDPSVWDRQEAVIDFYIKRTNSDLEKLQSGGYKDQISDIESSWTPFSGTIKGELIPLVKSRKLAQAMNILETKQAQRSRTFLIAANGIIDSSRAEFAKRLDAVKVYIRSTVILVLTVVLVVFTASFVFTFLIINKYMIKVLRNIGASAQKIASGDLTINLEAKSDDEFGELAGDVNGIISTMKEVLRKIAGKTAYVLKDATDLTIYGKSVSQKVDKDLERTTTAAAATEEMSFTIGDIARNVNTASQSAENAKDVSARGKMIIGETVSSIEEVNGRIESASSKVKDLASLSKKIDEIVVLIKDIADQTNLLALNAAIEAARAGEHGRGFAVVADEVGKLAQRTSNATSDINNILGSIHSGIVQATDMMDLAVGKANATSGLAHKLEESFKEINASFGKVSDMIREVVTTTEEQSATATDISNNLGGITEDAKKSSQTVKEMALSFNKFNLNAREFLGILEGFTDPVVRIGVLKSDYVLWLHGILDLLDAGGTSIPLDELDADRSGIGKWYYGEGRRDFGGTAAYNELESPHKRLHDLGLKACEAAKKGDKDNSRQCISEAGLVIDEIISILNRFDKAA